MKYFITLLFASVCLFHFGLGQNNIDWENVEHLNYVHPLLKPKILNHKFKHLEGRIINGEEVKPHQYPHQAALFLQMGENVAFCGGSLISKRYILTAAHCAYGISNFTVILGAHNIKTNEKTTQTYYTNEKVVHPKWAISQLLLLNDIALVKLPQDAELNEFVQPIRLPSSSQSETTFAGLKATILGWGKTSDASNEVSPVLRHVSNEIESPESCKAIYSGEIPISSRSHICFSTQNGRGACNGDSGGPMIVTDSDNKVTQVGIASFVSGHGCEADYPTVYTRISSFLDFIADNSDVKIN